MQMSGEQRVAAPRRRVWEALNDPEVLRRCIPGCQSLDRDGDDRFIATAEIKIGPIGARFKGQVELSDIDAPNGYTITGSGNGGIAGSAKGGAKVRLSDAGDGATLVSYDVDAEVGGRMAQLGGPIIDATAKNLAGKFFKTFGDVVGGDVVSGDVAAPVASAATPVPESAAPAPAAPVAEPVTAPFSYPPVAATLAPLWSWVVALVLAILVGFMLGRNNYNGVVALVVAILVILAAAAGYEAGRRGGRR